MVDKMIRNTSINDLFSIESKIDLFLKKIKKQQPWRAIYYGLIPRRIRKNIEYKLDLKQQKRIYDCWGVVLKLIENGELSDFKLLPKKQLNDSKIIWQYWGQDCAFSELPEVVQIGFKSVEKYKGEYKIIRLNDKIINEYIELPNFVHKKRLNPEFRFTFFSDLLRLALLNTYGGVWIDATVLLTNKIPTSILEQDFFLFQRNKISNYKNKFNKMNLYFSWENNHRINHLTSFIVSNKENRTSQVLLNALLHFWETQNHIPHYFFFQILINKITNENSIHKIKLDIDDTLPHLLQMIIKNDFSLIEYNNILEKTSIHKLTYIKKYKKNSYFNYLKSNFIE